MEESRQFRTRNGTSPAAAEKPQDSHHPLQIDQALGGRQQRTSSVEKKCESLTARYRMKAVPLGGRSKRDLLGSVADSWGTMEEEPRYGMFDIEKDPPSRSTSPFKIENPDRATLRAARADAFKRARAGTSYDSDPVDRMIPRLAGMSTEDSARQTPEARSHRSREQFNIITADTWEPTRPARIHPPRDWHRNQSFGQDSHHRVPEQVLRSDYSHEAAAESKCASGELGRAEASILAINSGMPIPRTARRS